MDSDNAYITRRHLPHWVIKEATYFVTFRIKRGQNLTVEEQQNVLEHIKSGGGIYYLLCAAVIMPDHVHVILTPMEKFSLQEIMKGIKGVTARKINLNQRSRGSVWQDESFDRIVRDSKELDEKVNYMFNNPLKKGLTEDPWSYHGWYYNEKFFER